MGLTGFAGGGAAEAFQSLVAQRMEQELREKMELQQQFENQMRLQAAEEARQAREEELAYRKRQETRQERLDREARGEKTIQVLHETWDPETMTAANVTPEMAESVKGTVAAGRLRGAPKLGPYAPGETPEVVQQLIPTLEQRELGRAAETRRGKETRHGELLARTDLAPETREWLGLVGPEAVDQITSQQLVTTAEAKRRADEAARRQIAINVASRAPREPDKPDTVIIKDGRQRLVTAREASRLIDTEGYQLLDRQTGKALGAGGRGAEGELAKVNALRVVEKLDSLQKTFNTVPGGIVTGPLAYGKGWIDKTMGAWGQNENVAIYQDSIEGFVPMLARAVGHVGVLTQQDVDSVKKLLPAVGQPSNESAKKIQMFVDIISGADPETAARAGTIDPTKSGLAAWVPADPNDKTPLAVRLRAVGLLTEPGAEPGAAPGEPPAGADDMGDGYDWYERMRRGFK